jgi:hypothetical protein
VGQGDVKPCPQCGAALPIWQGQADYRCDYCDGIELVWQAYVSSGNPAHAHAPSDYTSEDGKVKFAVGDPSP